MNFSNCHRTSLILESAYKEDVRYLSNALNKKEGVLILSPYGFGDEIVVSLILSRIPKSACVEINAGLQFDADSIVSFVDNHLSDGDGQIAVLKRAHLLNSDVMNRVLISFESKRITPLLVSSPSIIKSVTALDIRWQYEMKPLETSMFKDSLVKESCDMCMGHPFYVSKMMDYILDDRLSIDDAWKRLLLSFSSTAQYRVGSLTPNQKHVLFGLALADSPVAACSASFCNSLDMGLSSVRRALGTLIDKDLVWYFDGGWCLIDPVLRSSIRLIYRDVNKKENIDGN